MMSFMNLYTLTYALFGLIKIRDLYVIAVFKKNKKIKATKQLQKIKYIHSLFKTDPSQHDTFKLVQ